ncbi:MAG: alpha/beta fold hydrolase [Planctomycetota bacterium]|nr:alpha/beta fold hydrolase [Planctomycetota bacterium]MCX8040758.1 alpha/beta fold hydrolase [Planctomycetota bacterium]MDW8373720.1 alpha/beta fold hydrolase [Planctomycetota bacterium]
MLVALHGFTETDESWYETLAHDIPALRCPLLPGHGGKPCPRDADVAGIVAALAAQMPDEPSDLLGYSMGGRVALRIALDHPEKVRRLILISCHPGIRDPEERRQRLRRDESLAQVLEEDGIGPFMAWWENQPALKPYEPYPAAVAESVRARRLNQDPRGLAACLRVLGGGAMEPVWHRLRELRMPVLLISGAADARYMRIMDEMAAYIPQHRREVVLRAGHAVHRERPQVVAQMVGAFLYGRAS